MYVYENIYVRIYIYRYVYIVGGFGVPIRDFWEIFWYKKFCGKINRQQKRAAFKIQKCSDHTGLREKKHYPKFLGYTPEIWGIPKNWGGFFALLSPKKWDFTTPKIWGTPEIWGYPRFLPQNLGLPQVPQIPQNPRF